MGLFGFLKRQPDPLPESDGPSPHYALAHVALRQFALANPVQFLGVVASPEAPQFFDAMLADVADYCGCRIPFDASAIRVHPMRLGDNLCAMLELPEPKEMAEAYLVALVVPSNALGDGDSDGSDVQGRYFTLEKGYSDTGESRTVLCEWNETGHLNYGDGPPPSVAGFAAALGQPQ